jgi:hypothetical protein
VKLGLRETGEIIGAEQSGRARVKAVKVLMVMLLGVALGILTGFGVSLLMVPAEPSGAVGRSLGDGFLIIPLLLLGFVISVAVSVGIAVRMGRHFGQHTA